MIQLCTLFIFFLGIFLGCQGEEVQTTELTGDEPTVANLLDGTSNSALDVQVIETEKREKRQTPNGGGEDDYLLFANRPFIVQRYLNRPINRRAFRQGSNAIGCDYDIREGLMFWSDEADDLIWEATLDGTNARVLVRTNITTVDGIAWDWVTKKLYWTDADEDDIEIYDPSNGNRKVLFKTGSPEESNPRAIVLDPATRTMYWTDWGTIPRIERASMDGALRSTIVDTDLHWPNALTLDYATQTLYWADAWIDKIEKSNVDGSMRMILPTLATAVRHPFGITFFEGYLYWSDWILDAILKAPVTDTTNSTSFYPGLYNDPMQLHVVNLYRQPYVNNPCADNNGGCTDLCLLSSTYAEGYSCSCVNNRVLGRDGRTCR